MDQTVDLAERLELADVFAPRRVNADQLVNLAGVGRGKGWAGNISIDPVRAEKRLADELEVTKAALPQHRGTSAARLEALGPSGQRPPLGMLLFDCVARRGVLGDRGIESEMSVLSRLAPDVPVAGFHTYGEIARTNGVRGFHNQTLVTLALA